MEPDAHSKARFCVRRMCLAAWLADLLESPEQARACARAVFLYQDGFLKTAPQVRNTHKRHRKAGEAKQALARLRVDYEQFYDRIRDGLTGHQLPMGPLEAAVLFNEVDQTAVTLLVEDAKQVATLLAEMDPAVTEPLESPDTADGLTAEAAREMPSREQGVVTRMDRLALNNANTVGAISIDPLQESGGIVLSCSELFNVVHGLYERLPASSEAASLLSVLALLDATNLIDALFGRNALGATDPGFVEHARTGGLSNAMSFARIQGLLSPARTPVLRDRRNHVAGHVERAWTLTQVKREEQLIRISELRQLVELITNQFLQTCRSDNQTLIFATHGQRARFVNGVEPTDLIVPYRVTDAGQT